MSMVCCTPNSDRIADIAPLRFRAKTAPETTCVGRMQTLLDAMTVEILGRVGRPCPLRFARRLADMPCIVLVENVVDAVN